MGRHENMYPDKTNVKCIINYREHTNEKSEWKEISIPEFKERFETTLGKHVTFVGLSKLHDVKYTNTDDGPSDHYITGVLKTTEGIVYNLCVKTFPPCYNGDNFYHYVDIFAKKNKEDDFLKIDPNHCKILFIENSNPNQYTFSMYTDINENHTFNERICPSKSISYGRFLELSQNNVGLYKHDFQSDSNSTGGLSLFCSIL